MSIAIPFVSLTDSFKVKLGLVLLTGEASVFAGSRPGFRLSGIAAAVSAAGKPVEFDGKLRFPGFEASFSEGQGKGCLEKGRYTRSREAGFLPNGQKARSAAFLGFGSAGIASGFSRPVGFSAAAAVRVRSWRVL